EPSTMLCMVPLPTKLWGGLLAWPSKHFQPLVHADEFLAGGTGASLCFLCLLDRPPVGEAGRLDPALGEQSVKPVAAGLAAVRTWGHGRLDLLGDFIAVGAVGPDRPGRTAPRPPDAP